MDDPHARPADDGPSDMLARLADLVLETWRQPEGEALVEAGIARAGEWEPDDAPDEWLMPAATLCAAVLDELGGTIPARIEDEGTAHRVVAALQRLDRWHEPLRFHRHLTMPRSPEQDEALNRLYGRSQRFNALDPLGSVIPGQCPGFDMPEPDERAAGPLLRLLDATAYLPPFVVADAADEHGPPHDPVALHYRLSRATDARLPAGTRSLRIAIAPMAEAADDLEFRVEGAGYSIRPTYPLPRLDRALDRALAADAHVLLIPEMAVAAEHLPDLGRAVVAARRRFFDARRTPPSLAYVMAGAVTRADAGRRHRNFAVTMDARGRIVAEQDKLSHWNLTCGQQARFGKLAAAAGAPLLMENSAPGTAVTLVDVDGLGRALTLICADMNQNRPGDWLLEHLRIDWLYAPIMDGSTCWAQGSAPWIIARAAKAARAGRNRVAVSNSITMTRWNNDAIAEERARNPACRYLPYAECGVGLLLDATQGELRQKHVTVPLASTDPPHVGCAQWLDGWVAVADTAS